MTRPCRWSVAASLLALAALGAGCAAFCPCPTAQRSGLACVALAALTGVLVIGEPGR